MLLALFFLDVGLAVVALRAQGLQALLLAE